MVDVAVCITSHLLVCFVFFPPCVPTPPTATFIAAAEPSSEIFNSFDRLMLLAKGEVAYFGPADESIAYFERIGLPCPTYSNPADHYLSMLDPMVGAGRDC